MNTHTPTVIGPVLATRCSLPTLLGHGGYRIHLSPRNEWTVEPTWHGRVEPGRDHAREGDTGANHEWIVYPTWSNGYAMTIDLLAGQTATITRPDDDVEDALHVEITDIEGNPVASCTYQRVFLLVRAQMIRPLPEQQPEAL